MNFKKLTIFSIGLILVLFAVNTAHAGWMEGKILAASQGNNGEIVLKFYRNSTSSEINAMVDETLNQTQKNAILAIALSAISLDYTVNAFFDWGVGRFEGLTLIAP